MNEEQFNRLYNMEMNETAQPSQLPEKPKKPKKSHATAKVAGLLAGVIVLGGGAGFGGAYLAKSGLVSASGSNASAASKPGRAESPVDTPTLDELQQNVSSPAHNATSDVEFNSDGSYKYTRDLVKAVQDSIVYIFGYVEQGGEKKAKSACSGVIISTDGYIVTNEHFTSTSTSFSVKVNTTDRATGEVTSERYDAELIGEDNDTDLAVLKIKASGLSPAKLGDSDKLCLGDDVVAIGNPLSLENSVSKGVVSGLNREISASGHGLHSIQTDAVINDGNSGGGLFNQHGEVVGITNMRRVGTYVEGLTFAITINEAKDVINDLITYGYVKGRSFLGIQYVPVTDYFQNVTGWQIAKIYSELPIADSGLVVGDTIVSIDGVAVGDTAITDVFASKKPGDVVDVVVIRYDNFGRSKQVTVKIELGEYTGE